MKKIFYLLISVLLISNVFAADWEQVDGPYEGHITSFVRDSGTGKIYASATGIGLGGGVFVSSDNGDSWNRVAGNASLGDAVYNIPQHFGIFYENIALPDVTGVPVGNFRLGIDPSTSPNTLYAAYYYSNAPSRVIRSTDEGNTWNDFSNGLPLPGSHFPNAFASAPNGDMFLATKGVKGVYRLPAGTSTWVACTTTASGLWAMDIAIDQNNGDIYYTSYASSAAGKPAVFRSIDNGTSFTETVMTTALVGAGAADAGGYNRLLSSIAIDNTVTPPVIHVGLKERYQWMTQQPVANGGHFRSTDYGATWVSGTAMNVECLSVDSAGRVFLGTGNASNFYGAVYMSTDKGLTFTKINHPGIADTANVVGIEALASGTIFAGADGAYRSTDSGATWTHLVNSGIKATRRSVDVDIAPDGTIYSVSNEHGVSVSNDNGASWTIANGSGASRIGSLYVNSIDVDPVTQYVYAGTGLVNSSATGLWRSTNKGASWSKVTGFTPQYKTMATVFAQNGNIVTGGMFSPAGVFVSSNGGISAVSNTAMDAIYSLIVNPVNGDIYAGTETKATWLSTDHGVTFQQLTYTTAVTNGCTGQLGNKGNIFGMTFDSLGNTLYTAALHGLFKTSDKGVSFQEVAVPGLGGCG